jgi:hypothetical protein
MVLMVTILAAAKQQAAAHGRLDKDHRKHLLPHNHLFYRVQNVVLLFFRKM